MLEMIYLTLLVMTGKEDLQVTVGMTGPVKFLKLCCQISKFKKESQPPYLTQVMIQ